MKQKDDVDEAVGALFEVAEQVAEALEDDANHQELSRKLNDTLMDLKLLCLIRIGEKLERAEKLERGNEQEQAPPAQED